MNHANDAPISWLMEAEAISPGSLYSQVYQRCARSPFENRFIDGIRRLVVHPHRIRRFAAKFAAE